jgi:hypothetical protein
MSLYNQLLDSFHSKVEHKEMQTPDYL